MRDSAWLLSPTTIGLNSYKGESAASILYCTLVACFCNWTANPRLLIPIIKLAFSKLLDVDGLMKFQATGLLIAQIEIRMSAR